jgi:hypothetical protein
MDIRREILRNAILAQALGPLGGQPRLGRDEAPGPKPEHHLIAGVNSGWQFFDLADRVLQQGRQPDCIYDLAYEAQRLSVRNRLGGKVNYGQIQMLVPLVTAQALEFLATGTHEDVEAILARTGAVLRATTERDVESVQEFIHLGYDLSARHRERTGRPRSATRPILAGRYRSVWEASHDFQSIHTVREIISGYPYSLRIYRFLLHNLETGTLSALELIHRLLVQEIGRPDVVTDLVVVGLYLLLTKHPESALFL